MSYEQAQQALKGVYLIDFPDDLFHFWEFVKSFNAGDPLTVFSKPICVCLEGPFRVLAGRHDEVLPNGWYLGTRYYDDFPEFFTVFSGDTDGLHWGYWFDDPDNSLDYCLADYYSRDAFELTEDGETLFEAFRLQLEGCQMSTLENIETDPNIQQSRPSYEADLEDYATYRNRLLRYATAGRTEVGAEYLDKYSGISGRSVIADTFDGMGIVVPEHLHCSLSIGGEQLSGLVTADADLSFVLAEAHRALTEGFPGTALELGKNLWIGNPAQKQEAYRLLEGAYTALNRPTLATLLAKIAPLRTE